MMSKAKEIKKNVKVEVASAVVDSTFAALATAAGIPAISLALPFAKGLVLGLIENCYNDCAQRTLSVRESKKLNQVSDIALRTFLKLAEKDGVIAWEMNIDPAYIENAYEVAEHVTLEAIRQSELKKVDVLGRYYGNRFYKGDVNWQDMHQMITMVGMLTYRQIVLIRLISEGFKGLNGKLFVSNSSACVEINRLKDYGIWQTKGASFGINESWAIQLDSVVPTLYSKQVCDCLLLDRLSEEDVERTIDSLHLTTEGETQRVITEDDYKKHTDWQTFDEKGNIVIGGDLIDVPIADKKLF